jgi:AcrR family transcriptional regulator
MGGGSQVPTTTAKPLRADAQRNRDKIIDAARQLVRAKGMDAVSMDEVAKVAGVGAGTLYRHFPTKDDLYVAVVEAWAETVNARVDEAMSSAGTDRDRLLAWLRVYVEMLTAHKGAAARITASLGDPGSAYATKCTTYLSANERVIAALPSIRPTVDAMQICRVVGGVAAVADQSELNAAAVEPLIAVLADGFLD